MSEDVSWSAQGDAEGCGVDQVGRAGGVGDDAVVVGVDGGAQGGDQGAVLGGGEFALEDAALGPVEVFAAGFEDFGVAFGGGVVDEDDEDGGSPPGVEGLVGRVFEAEADQFQCFEVDEFLVANFPLEGAVVDGR
ncbi:hypothetical protein [Streptomyces nigrescens]